jgi:hypothetical protein
MVFKRSDFIQTPVTKQHVILFLERDTAIEQWNNNFLLKVMSEAKRVKEYLLA